MSQKSAMKTGFLLAAACAATACAQPDVIVGECYDIQNYGLNGAYRSFAFGTISCNKAPLAANNKPAPYNAYNFNALLWIDAASEVPSGAPSSDIKKHPVISQNMYRLLNGRFEQIGQAWLKHGFCALQGTQCSPCNSGGNCNSLYPGCSDPYSGSLNGGQSGLGPKSEVNVHTGDFPYPWINNGSGSGSLHKRLRVLDSDLAGTQAKFFIASMYVQFEDAAANLDNNNQSYRRVTVNNTDTAGGNISTTFPASTQREKPAIQAWQDEDPSVQITVVDVPGDGRFFVAVKVTNTSPGVFEYEYAIQNLTSDRSAQAFSLPLPSGATVTNIGFHDVDYHSGEPYSLTDWSNNGGSGGAMVWQTQTHAQNINANALRWDTLYNYRFTSNRAPTSGTGTLTLFKPGTPSSVSFATQVPGTGTGSGNDDCASALTISSGSILFDTSSATTDGPNECTFASYAGIGKDIWYRWTNTGTCTGTATVETCGSFFDTKIAVYNNACPTAAGTALACNDDACAGGPNAGNQLASRVTFTANAGATYLIRVGGYDPDNTGPLDPLSGNGTLTVTAPTCTPQGPANDACANAFWIADGVQQSGSTALATVDGTASCGNSSTTPDVWFKYRPVTSGTWNVKTCGSAYDTVLSIHSACGGTQLACNDDEGNSTACAGNTLQSSIDLAMTANTTYWIRVSGFNGATGNYNVLVTGGGGTIPPTPPSNDPCSGRIGITAGSYPFNTAAASTDGIAHACGQINNDLWWNVPSAIDRRVRVSTCGSAYDTKLALYRGSGCTDFASRLITCVDNTAGCAGNGASATTFISAGDNLTIRVGGATTATGTGTLLVEFLPLCVADVDDGSGMGVPDGGVTIEDLLYYMDIFDAGQPSADIDDGSETGTPDGGVTIEDLLYYLLRFDLGC